MFNSIQDTIHLAKNTFVILGKNKEALKPTFAQIKIGLGLYLLFLIGIIFIFEYVFIISYILGYPILNLTNGFM